MKIKKFMLYTLCAGMLFSTYACGDDEPTSTTDTEQGEGTGNGDENDPDSDAGEPMTVEESKSYIGNVAQEVANLFKPEDQRPLMDLFNYFIERYGDLEFADDNDSNYAPSRYIRNLRKAASGDLLALTRAAETYQYDLKFNDYTGIYEPAGYEWRKTGNSSDIEFRFTDQNGQNCVLKAVASSDYSNVNFEITGSDEYYNGSTWVEDSWSDEYRLQVPRTVTVTLTQGNATLATATVKSSLDMGNKKFSIDVDSKLANLRATATANGTDNIITGNARGYVDSKEFVNAQTTVNGSRLCDYDYISDIIEKENTAKIRGLFSNGTASGTIMNKMKLNLKGSFGQTFWNNVPTTYWDCYDYPSLSDARKKAENAVRELRNSVIGNFCFNSVNTERATLDYVIEEEDTDTDYWYLEIMPVIKFPDGTTYEFEDYFESGFDGVANTFDKLIDSYTRLWN